MTERRLLDPAYTPDYAAHEVIMELCSSGTFGFGPEAQAMGPSDGEALGKAISAAHQALADYYRTLQQS